MTTINSTIKANINKSTDYTPLAASLDYAALEKKLAHWAERQPPKRRKNISGRMESPHVVTHPGCSRRGHEALTTPLLEAATVECGTVIPI